MNGISILTEPQRNGRRAAEAQVVLALTQRERALFLPGPADGRRVVNTEGLSPARWEEILRELRPEVLVTAWSCPPLPAGWLADRDCSLRYVCHLAGGVKFVPRAFIERGGLVSNWGATISHTIAEHAVLMALALLRELPRWSGFIRQWHAQAHAHSAVALGTRSLRGKRVGLHGFGAIAREIAQMLHPFQVSLSAFSHGVPARLFAEYEVRQAASLEELFGGSDVLIECEAVNEHSRGSVSRRVLELLPRGAVFVNVGRMAVVEHDALVELTLAGRLRTGLDVYPREPIPPHYPLCASEHALLSPHLAGPTGDAFAGMGDYALANVERYLRGERPESLVTPEIYDRTT